MNLDHKKWHVGKIGRDIVSKGMKVQYRLPQFDQVELKQLLGSGYLDAILIRLKRRTYSESETLDTFYLQLGRRRSDSENDFLISQVREINLHLAYAASSVDRLARLMCPALNHRLLIEDFDTEPPLTKSASYRISVESGYSNFVSNIRQFEGGRHLINAGKSFIGAYYLEIAFYDTIKRRIVGDFIPASEVFRISNEELIDIPFCDDTKNSNNSKVQDVRSFKFGR